MAQADLVRRGEVSPLELVDAAIARIESLNPQINALASSDFALARGKALAASSHGVLAAVPTLIKDLLAYPGLRLERGSRLFKGHMAEVISPYAEALGRAGLIALGKTTTSELGLLGTTETLACGATRNPWDLSRSSGGSSGGAAAAVASGMVPVAHASDGGGSIRGPGSFCGLFGFKPSRGRTLAADVPPTLPTAGLLSEHCLSRSVRDSAAWLAITERNDPEAPFAPLGMLTEPPRNRLRIGVYRQDVFGRDPEPAALAALEHACRLCREIGHEIVEVAAPRYAPDAPKNAFFLLTGAVLAGTFDFLQQAMGPAFRPELAEPYTLELIRRAAQSSPAQLVQAQKALASGQLIAEQSMASFDLLLCPTVADVAFPLQRYRPTDAADKLIAFTESVAGYTVIASVAGWPAMSIPLYRNADGLPLGSHFAAPCGREDLLFGLAYQLEQAADWGNDWPDLLAEV
ncbi:MAG: amidase [Desulfuromonas sp.]|nr:MAG: amidase [Desulfuromonas sp.]